MSQNKPSVFTVLGMPRAGTTFLYHTLGQHPGIYMPYRKESLYFSVNYDKGEDWYRSLYEGMSADQIGADINPLYYLDPDALERILAYDPGMRVILSVRDPVSFAVSQYGNILTMGWEAPPITEWIQGYEWKLSDTGSVSFALTGGFHERRIRQIMQRFGGRLLLYRFGHFQDQPLSVLREIEGFLGLPPHFDETNLDNRRINASGRRNLRLLNALLTRQRFLDTLYRILPDAAIRRGRSLFDKLSVSERAGAQPDSAVSAEERAELERALAGDSRFYNSLFESGDVLKP